MTARTLYDNLGVRQDASAEEIKKAYRRLAAKTHPDVGGEAMAPLFMTIQEAYETLGNQARRDSYDYSLQAAGPGAPPPGKPAPEPAPETGTEKKPARDSPGAADLEDAPAKTAEYVRRRRTPRSFYMLTALWLCVLPLLFLSEAPVGVLLEEGTSLPAGSGTLTYAGLWTAGIIRTVAARRGSTPALPLLAAAAGAGAAWGFHAGMEIPVAVHAAAGLGLTLAAGAFSRQRRNLARIGIKGSAVPRTLTFQARLSPEDKAALRRTYRCFGALLTQPGTRILEGVSVGGRSLHHLVVNGDRAAVVDSRIIPSWVQGLTGDLAGDFDAAADSLPTTLVEDLKGLGWVKPGRRAGWLAVHPERSGSVELESSGGSQLHAAAPAVAADRLYRWFAEGDRYGEVDPRFLYRLVHEGCSPLRNYR